MTQRVRARLCSVLHNVVVPLFIPFPPTNTTLKLHTVQNMVSARTRVKIYFGSVPCDAWGHVVGYRDLEQEEPSGVIWVQLSASGGLFCCPAPMCAII